MGGVASRFRETTIFNGKFTADQKGTILGVCVTGSILYKLYITRYAINKTIVDEVRREELKNEKSSDAILWGAGEGMVYTIFYPISAPWILGKGVVTYFLPNEYMYDEAKNTVVTKSNDKMTSDMRFLVLGVSRVSIYLLSIMLHEKYKYNLRFCMPFGE